MQNFMNLDGKLVEFLRQLANHIENDELLPSQKKSVGEFYMSYKFQEQVLVDNGIIPSIISEKDDDELSEKSSETSINFTHAEMVKFFTLGWFVYCMILQGKSLNSNIDENMCSSFMSDKSSSSEKSNTNKNTE